MAKEAQAMIQAIRVESIVEKDGEITLTGLPYKKGDTVEMILLSSPESKRRKHSITAGELARSEIVGVWGDRKDIQDSSTFARQLRDRAQQREA